MYLSTVAEGIGPWPADNRQRQMSAEIWAHGASSVAVVANVNLLAGSGFGVESDQALKISRMFTYKKTVLRRQAGLLSIHTGNSPMGAVSKGVMAVRP